MEKTPQEQTVSMQKVIEKLEENYSIDLIKSMIDE